MEEVKWWYGRPVQTESSDSRLASRIDNGVSANASTPTRSAKGPRVDRIVFLLLPLVGTDHERYVMPTKEKMSMYAEMIASTTTCALVTLLKK